MKELVEFRLSDNSDEMVTIEFDNFEDGNYAQRVSRGDEASTVKSDKSFDQVLAKVRPVANAVIDSLKDLNRPEEINLEFGLKFGAKAGIIFTSADSEATFKLSLKWKNTH